MKTDKIKELFVQFESIACEYLGVECWSARELCTLLGYAQWRNFELIIAKAKVACESAGGDVEYHFADVSKMVELGSGSLDDGTIRKVSVRDAFVRLYNEPVPHFYQKN